MGHLQGRATAERLNREVFTSHACRGLLNGEQKYTMRELSQGYLPPSLWRALGAPGVLEGTQGVPPISAPGCPESSDEQMPVLWALCADPSPGAKGD